jgi:zinc transporter ZupT
LGFAAGAMLVVGVFELIVEAIEDTDKITTVSLIEMTCKMHVYNCLCLFDAA